MLAIPQRNIAQNSVDLTGVMDGETPDHDAFVAGESRQYSAARSGVSQNPRLSGNGHSRSAITLYSLAATAAGASFNAMPGAGVTG
jgi:hypothetical protein